MKRLTVFLSAALPLVVLFPSLALLRLSSKIYASFYNEFLEGAALPILTQFFIGWTSTATVVLVVMLFGFFFLSILLPTAIKDRDKLILAYSIYHVALLAFVTVFLGGLLISLALPLHEAHYAIGG